MDEHDRRENELSLREGFRILSAYTLPSGAKIWVITEADRSSTCLLLPEGILQMARSNFLPGRRAKSCTIYCCGSPLQERAEPLELSNVLHSR